MILFSEMLYTVMEILDMIIAFFLLGVMFAIPVGILVYFVISLVKYIERKKHPDSDWVRKNDDMKRAKWNLIFALSILMLFLLGIVFPFFWVVMIFAIPVGGLLYFIFSLVEYLKQKKQADHNGEESKKRMKRAKWNLGISSTIMAFFVLIVIALIYAFSQELFYM